MSDPTFKMMSLRQAFIGYMLSEIARYVIRQWELAHTGKEPDLSEDVYRFSVQFPEMIAKDTTRYAAALQQVTQAVSLAITDKLMSVKTGVQVIESIAGQLGVKFDAEQELEAIAEQAEIVQKNVQNQDLESKDNGDTKSAKITEAVATKPEPKFTADQQVIEDGVADVLGNIDSPIDPAVIYEAVKAAKDYEDLADRLAVLMGSDSAEFEQHLERATFVADVLGFAHASD